MLNTTIDAIGILTKEQLTKASALHTKYMLGASVLLVFLVVIGTVINTIAPLSGWNAIIAMVLGLGAFFLITKPTALAIIFLAGALGGLPNLEIRKIFDDGLRALPDFKSKDVFESGVKGLEKWLAISGYVILSVMLFHLVLEFVPFHGNIMLVFTVLAILEGLAVREYLYYKESASAHYKKWTLYLLLAALFVSIIRVASLSISGEDIRKTVTAIPSYITRGEEDWVPVSMVTTCTPTWNEKQGWCDIGTFPAGTYRVVPQFETWQMGLAPSNPPKATDRESYPMSAEGLDVKIYLRDNKQIADFLKTAFVKSHRYGALIVKTSTSLPIEVIGNDGLPRELVLEKESKMSINVNLPKIPERFSTNRGTLTVEVQKLSL